jgi:putative ATP-dependent endonuclease of the OLD family
MSIQRLSIQNFRSVENIDLELTPLTAFVGPNNAGKSNVLLALRTVLARDWVSVTSFSEDDVHLRDPARNIAIRVHFDQPIPYAKIRGTPPANICSIAFEYTRYKVGGRKGERRLVQTCFDAKGSVPTVSAQAFKAGVQPKFEPVINVPSEVREALPVIYVGTDRGLAEHLPSARYGLLRPLIEDIDCDLRDPRNTIAVSRPDGTVHDVARTERFLELMTEVLQVLRTPQLIGLETEIKQGALRQLGLDPIRDAASLDLFFGPLESEDFYRALQLQLREGSFTVNATQLGEGVQNAIVLAVLQAFEQRRKQGAVFLIEEPEMFLHPQRQRSLYETLRHISSSNQVIYTTHSPHFVAIPEYTEVVLVRRSGSATLVTRSNLPQSPQRREKLRKELDPERNELFFATRTLLVEGDTEKLALPEYAKRLGLDLNRAGVSIVEVGGKRNLPELAQIGRSFGIPVGILYDRDSSDFAEGRDREAAFNAELEALAATDGSARVWQFTPNYESALRSAFGDAKYLAACQRYPSVSKVIRARLIAAEDTSPIPPGVEDALRWAVDAGLNLQNT